MSRIFVGELPFHYSNEDIKEMFSKHGTIIDSDIIKDRNTGSSRGFGFVTFEKEEEAKSAINALNNTMLNERKLKVEVAVLRTERPQVLPPV